MTNNQHRIRELDALRGLAAMAVVLFHFTSQFDRLYGHSTPLRFSLPRGDLGVDFFFMLSGFVILMTLDRMPSALEFVVGRLARLYPAYWAAAAITLAVVAWAGLPGQEVSLGEAVVNATMLPRVLGARPIDSAYWSLQVELLFYAAMLVLHRSGALKTPRWPMTLALWLALATAAQFVAAQFAAAQFVADTTPLVPAASGPLALTFVTKLQTVLSLKYLHLFAVGIVLYRVHGAGRWTPAAWLLLAWCALVQARLDSWSAAGVVIVLAAVLHAAAHGRPRFLATPPLVFLGTISYPLYLIHQNVGYVVIRNLEAAGMEASLAVATAVAGSLLLATGLSFGIERPAMAAIKGWHRPGKGAAAFRKIPTGEIG